MKGKSNIITIIILTFFLFFVIMSIPLREELSLYHGSELISPLAAKIAIDRRHAFEAYLQTLGPDMDYAAYYSTDYY
tara:strand:+ start:378 stop:608 length:231 start_codon:yes stop_codon:yes gene_type:complete